jgi:TRAP transporter TAXI family solute receptor
MHSTPAALVRIKICLWAMLLWFSTGSCAAWARPAFNIVTGPEKATFVQIGNDLSKYVASPANIDLTVLNSNGAVDNIRRLRDEPGTRLAFVQSDVYQAFKAMAAGGNKEAARVIAPLRVIVPLYDADLHFVVRADSPLNSIQDIRDQRINIGPLGSGSALSSSTLYRLMFGADALDKNITTLSHEDALVRLVKEKDIDVVAVVSGQPVPIFLGMEPGVEKYFKLLRLDERDPTFERIASTYDKATLKAASYPGWLGADVPSLSVRTFLVTYDYDLQATKNSLVRFAKSLCDNFGVLQKEGHPKWRQIGLQLPALNDGWQYYPPTQQEIGRCRKFKQKPARSCSLQEKVSGLCAEP